jgi:hypothetical protein
MSEARQQSENCDRGIEVQSSGKSDGGQKCKELAGRDLQGIEHDLRYCRDDRMRVLKEKGPLQERPSTIFSLSHR